MNSEKLPFDTGDLVVYPTHGVGKIVGIETQEIAGHTLSVFVVLFDKDRMTLRVPLAKVMAIDHAAQNIRVNTLSPGAVETERTLRRYGSFEAGRRALARSICWDASDSRGKLPKQRCFSPATPRASLPAATSSSTAVIRRCEEPVQAVSSCSTRCVAVVSSIRSTAANSRTSLSRAA